MSDLKRFRDYARDLASGGHTPACVIAVAEARRRWGYFAMFREWPLQWGEGPSGPPAACDGECVTDDDRALWIRLAAEIDDYLAPQPDLFGETTDEPIGEVA